MDEGVVKKILGEARTIAVVGLSKNPQKAAHSVPKYMQQQGYQIIPVNPSATEVLGEKCYPSLAELPTGARIDVVNVFRPGEDCDDVVRQALQLGPKPKLIWLQLGIENEEARRLSKEAGVEFVQDECIYVVHQRHFHR